jgi:glycine cleavage system aminomethyltransferase T
MDPREFQTLASTLVNGKTPAEIRTAISRAYYATHNVGAEFLSELGFRIPKNASGHGEVWNRLSNSGDKEIMNVGSKLQTLHGMRLRADYRLDEKEVENQKTAQGLVEQANRMINILDEKFSGSKKVQIIKAIQDWERKVSGGTS